MDSVLIGIGAIVLVAILLVVFRVTTLVAVLKGSDKKRASSSNKVNAGLFMAFLIFGFGAFFWYSSTYYDNYTLPVASEHGVATDNLFWITMAVTGVVFFLTHVLLFWFAYRYQFSEKRSAVFYPDNGKLELIWTIVPAIVLSLLVFSGWRVWVDITEEAPQEAVEVELLGHQFAWLARYPGKDGQMGDFDYRMINTINNMRGLNYSDKSSLDDFMPTEIHLPKGQPVVFKIRSRDVLHSVFAPHFRLKMDAVPGMPTSFWFTPTKTTEEMKEETGNEDFRYEIACTEVCGRAHFSMRIYVVVHEPDEYKEWVEQQRPMIALDPSRVNLVPDNLVPYMLETIDFTEEERVGVDAVLAERGLIEGNGLDAQGPTAENEVAAPENEEKAIEEEEKPQVQTAAL